MEYYVSKKGSDLNCGSIEAPFLTISKAAQVADEYDVVTVCEGEYRECVTFEKGVENSGKRITFKAADGEKVIVKGSEIIKNWEKHTDTVYKTVIPNSFFGSYNPYNDIIAGDWYVRPLEYRIHTGQVYINGVALREVGSLADIKNNNWYSEIKDDATVIYANFGHLIPDGNTVEINVRKACFEAAHAGINYITISGFEICHAATQWSPPTAGQSGAVCANMCKGWIIENNHIHNSRCNGICIGKDKITGHNENLRRPKVTGHMSQLEVMFAALARGWSKETVGGHIIRNNVIHDCGQTGIVGHMGCAFSEVYGNHIYNIQHDDEFWGHEIAGIKFHAAIDTYIHNNCIHNCYRGMWLDWQAQGVRVSSNLFFDNMHQDDLYIEVTHGPQLVDNNILLSKIAFRTHAQGNACVHNLIGGLVARHPQVRFTPYHFPHSTQIKGISATASRDDRYYNNIFCGGEKEETDKDRYGTSTYNGSTTSAEEYIDLCRTVAADGDRNDFLYPAYINCNSYFGNAKPFEKEIDKTITTAHLSISISEEADGFYLELDMPESAFMKGTELKGTHNLPLAFLTEADFENADGSPLVIDKDYNGNERSTSPVVGPFEDLKVGKNRILVWSKNSCN